MRKTKTNELKPLDGFITKLRMRRIISQIALKPDVVLLDIGCGAKAIFLNSIKDRIYKGYGIDAKDCQCADEKIALTSYRIEKELPYADNSFDVVVMLAVLEHLEYPEAVISEISRVLKPGGQLILTVPSWLAKPVLEFMAYKLSIINADSILDHKTYYNRRNIEGLFDKAKTSLEITKHQYFWLWLNNLVVARKKNL